MGLHAMSQPPQWAVFERVSVHAPTDAQYSEPDVGQRHVPEEQISVASQALSHAPQWIALEPVSTQASTEAQ